jgi:calcineurin-like phosphoesterase
MSSAFLRTFMEKQLQKNKHLHTMSMGVLVRWLGVTPTFKTADERVLPGGTAAITDVGMCGCFDSVIGMRKELSIERFITQRKVKFEPADGPGGYSAVLVELDDITGLAKGIQRFRETQV